MADLASLIIPIKVTGYTEAVNHIDQVKNAGVQAQGSLKSLDGSTNFSSLISSIRNVVLALGGLYILREIMTSWYGLIKNGVLAYDELQKKIVGTSYILSTMSIVPQGGLNKAYGEWKNYFDWLYRQSLEADKKSAASAQDIFGVSVELAKKGVVASTKEEVDTIGRLTDLMKAVTPQYASLEQQARGEIEAMMSGTQRMGAQTAIILGQIDPEFKKNIANARESGTVLEYIRSILPQIKQYTLDLMGTWDAVSASVKSAFNVVQIKAFGDAHKDIVTFASQLADKLVAEGELTKEGEALAKALGQAWSVVKDNVEGAFNYILKNPDKIISNISTFVSAMGKIGGVAIDLTVGFAKFLDVLDSFAMKLGVGIAISRASIGYLSESFTILGTTAKEVIHGIIWNFGEIGPAAERGYAAMLNASERWSHNAIQDANNVRFAVMNSMMTGARPEGFAFMGGEKATPTAAKPTSPNAPTVPKVRPFTGKEEKGGGSADAEANRLMSLFDTLTKDIARLSEGKLSEIEANFQRTVDQIYKKTEHRVTSEAELASLAKQREVLQKEKAEEEYSLFVAKNSGDQYAEIAAQAKKWLTDYKGFKDAEKNINEITARQNRLVEINQFTEVTNLQKTYFDTMAGLSPILSDQLVLKRQSLDLENQLALAAIDKLVTEKPYLAYLKDELILRQALMNQAKKYNLEMENNQGFAGWAWSRAKEADQKGTLKDMMGGLESGFQSAFSSGLQGVLAHDQQSLKKIGSTMFQGFLGEITKKSITGLFDFTSKLFRPESPTSISDMGTGKGLTTITSSTGKQLSTAAQGLQKASVGFNLNTAQFGLAAGGLLLSGLGIALNSQALVYAGTILQVAGLAIQIYQALTATSTMMSMGVAAAALTGSAVALSGAASMLMMAAAVDAIPFFHGGGLIAHKGMLVAHRGLNLDERHIIAQTGEGILQRSAMQSYARQGISFDMLNNGRLPIVPMHSGGNSHTSDSGGNAGPITVNVTHNASYHYKATEADYRKDAKAIVKAINSQLVNRNQPLIGDGSH